MRRELTFHEYTCDGLTPSGNPCKTRETLTAYRGLDPELAPNEATGWTWMYFGIGEYLCPFLHKDDPRVK